MVNLELMIRHGRQSVLLFYTIGIPAMACQAIVARGFYALKDTWTPVKVGVCAVALALALNCMIYYCGWLEGRWLALSASAVAVANVFCLMILMNRRLVDFGIRRLIKLFVTAVLSSTVAGGAAWGLGVIIGRAGSCSKWGHEIFTCISTNRYCH